MAHNMPYGPQGYPLPPFGAYLTGHYGQNAQYPHQFTGFHGPSHPNVNHERDRKNPLGDDPYYSHERAAPFEQHFYDRTAAEGGPARPFTDGGAIPREDWATVELLKQLSDLKAKYNEAKKKLQEKEDIITEHKKKMKAQEEAAERKDRGHQKTLHQTQTRCHEEIDELVNARKALESEG